MIFPEKLKKGDTVGIICPCSPIKEELTLKCVELFEARGYKVKLADNLNTDLGGFMAGDGRTRAEWVNRMFADPEVKAVFCATGGAGCNRIMPYVDFKMIKNNPKIFIGYSDVTHLSLALNQMCDLVTYHGPFVTYNLIENYDKQSEECLFNVLNGTGEYVYTDADTEPVKVLKEGKAKAQITGGNLTLMATSIGTPYEVDTDGKIVFFEDIGGYVSQFDRVLFQMKAAGKFEKCKGVLIGQFSFTTKDSENGYDVIDCFRDCFAEYDIPVMYNLQTGHEKTNLTIPIGAECEINTADRSIKFMLGGN